MNCDDQVSSTIPPLELIKKTHSSSICKVCGEEDAQIHYGALCCISCKIFFRRNSQFNLVSYFKKIFYSKPNF